MTRRLLVVSDHLRCLGVRRVVMEAISDHHYFGMLRHTHGSQAQSTHRDRGSTPHIHRTEHTTPPGPGEYPNTPDTPDTPPGNTGPHASVPESTPHTGPPADTDHAPHPVAPADHTQDPSTGAKSSEH
jgi:hypothetical protein